MARWLTPAVARLLDTVICDLAVYQIDLGSDGCLGELPFGMEWFGYCGNGVLDVYPSQ
jgi:hypothetical protein